jgi:hypothetical protein
MLKNIQPIKKLAGVAKVKTIFSLDTKNTLA